MDQGAAAEERLPPSEDAHHPRELAEDGDVLRVVELVVVGDQALGIAVAAVLVLEVSLLLHIWTVRFVHLECCKRLIGI